MREQPGAGGRSFGIAFGGLFAALALYRVWRGNLTAASVLAIASGVIFIVAWAAPRLLERPNRIWMRFAHVLGWINSRILLSVFFFLVITPYAVVQRLVGRDRLARRWRAAPPSWTPAPKRLHDPKHYEHLY